MSRLPLKNAAGLLGDLLRVGIVGFLFFGLAMIVKHGGANHYVATFRQWVIAYASKPSMENRATGIALFISGSSLLISVGIPRLWISALAGALYGAAFGTLWALAASVMGAAVVYGLGRTILSGLVERRFKGKLEAWKNRFLENAFWWVLYARLFPFANSSLTSLVCGGYRVPFRQFMVASLAGFIPLTIVLVAFGSGGFHGNLHQVALGFGILGLTVWMRRWLSNLENGKIRS